MSAHSTEYHRYHIEARNAPGVARWPTRFRVRVGRVGLAKHLIKEVVKTRANMEVVLSRPCLYGTYSGPIGGFAPRPEYCVGCLRCMNEYYEFCVISPNPDRLKLGDSFFTSNYVDQLTYESETGMVPVKGAGYRGKFGGQGWDGMWTDMSEIVRPTRDGIHGREFISTSVDIGTKPNFLIFDAAGQSEGEEAHTFSLPVPFIFDALPVSVDFKKTWRSLSEAATSVQTLSVVPVSSLGRYGLAGEQFVPLIAPENRADLSAISFTPRLIEMEGWDTSTFAELQKRFPKTLICLRVPFGSKEATTCPRGSRPCIISARILRFRY